MKKECEKPLGLQKLGGITNSAYPISNFTVTPKFKEICQKTLLVHKCCIAKRIESKSAIYCKGVGFTN